MVRVLMLISIFLPIVLGGGSSSPGVMVRPGDGVYPVGMPVSIILEDVHMCAWIAVQVDGLEPDEYLATGSCDTGLGIVELRVLVPATVERVSLTPVWFNGDPCRIYTARMQMQFEAGE